MEFWDELLTQNLEYVKGFYFEKPLVGIKRKFNRTPVIIKYQLVR